MGNARERLLTLEAEGRFLFHGSPLLLEELIPKQLVNFDRKTGKKSKDGNPAVAATPFASIAIFRAIVNPRNFPFGRGYGSSFGITPEGNIRLEVTRKTWEHLRGKTGYVYVLSRQGFSPFRSWDWRSESKVVPLEVIAISAEDLPKNIQVKERI
jgi:hypothetical protein